LFQPANEDKELKTLIPQNFTAELHHKFKISTKNTQLFENDNTIELNNIILYHKNDSLPFMVYNCNTYKLVAKELNRK